MLGIVGVVASLTVLGLSLAVTKIATIALEKTGLSSGVARFQSRSAFTGTGFTTSETEKVVNHPVRRRIISLLMITRSAGVITIIISLILSFVEPGTDVSRLLRLAWIVAGVIVLFLISRSKIVNRVLDAAIGWALERWTDLENVDYLSLLKLQGDYTVTELSVQEEDWIAGKTLSECSLNEEGVTVLGIQRRNGTYVGAPRGNTKVMAQDSLILYGRRRLIDELDTREHGPLGTQAHHRAVAEQKEYERRESEEDRRAVAEQKSSGP